MNKGKNYVNPTKRQKKKPKTPKLPCEAERKSYPILQMRVLSFGEVKGLAQKLQPRRAGWGWVGTDR